MSSCVLYVIFEPRKLGLCKFFYKSHVRFDFFLLLQIQFQCVCIKESSLWNKSSVRKSFLWESYEQIRISERERLIWEIQNWCLFLFLRKTKSQEKQVCMNSTQMSEVFLNLIIYYWGFFSMKIDTNQIVDDSCISNRELSNFLH